MRHIADPCRPPEKKKGENRDHYDIEDQKAERKEKSLRDGVYKTEHEKLNPNVPCIVTAKIMIGLPDLYEKVKQFLWSSRFGCQHSFETIKFIIRIEHPLHIQSRY